MVSATGNVARWQRWASGAAVLGVLIVLSLIGLGVRRHPASMQGAGNQLLWTNVTLLLMYGSAAIWVWRQRSEAVGTAIRIGSLGGLLLGAVHAANHATETFVAVRNFALVIGPVFLMLAILGAVGSAVWERTRSLALAVMAGLWCAIVGTLIALCMAITLNLAFTTRVEVRLREAFAVSGMNDPSAFLVKNTLEAASEGLIRMPLFALALASVGGLISVFLSTRSRNGVLAAACLTPILFLFGAAALWHADSLQRVSRPPFVLAGVFLAGVALCGAHPVWSALGRKQQNC